MILFTSDTHFRHENILKYCLNRKFSCIEDHDSHLITMWNRKVSPKDTIFHLGDFAFGSVQCGIDILRCLNGKKILIQGNHDYRNLKSNEFRSMWDHIYFSYHEIEVSFRGHSKKIIMCHYPIESWNYQRHGSIHLHGHTHSSSPSIISNRLDIGVDSREDLGPWPKDEALSHIS